MTQPFQQFEHSIGGLRCAAVSDVGMRRANNQDALAISLAEDDQRWQTRGHLFVVADGMGAHAAGELASKIAADNIPHSYLKRSDLPPCQALAAAVEDANDRIHTKGQNSVDFQGMGTTCSCLVLLPEGAMAAHVGDSRIYRLRNDQIEQLTFDHSLVWEMGAAGHASEEEVPAYVPRNVITRSLGPHPAVKVDLEGPLPLQAGDRYLLCSDGLTGPLNPELIGLVVGALPPNEAAQTLVDLANLLGGPDNITVIVAEVIHPDHLGDTTSCRLPDSSPRSTSPGVRFDAPGQRGLLGAAILAVLCAAAFGMGQHMALAVASGAIAAMAAAGWLLLGMSGREGASGGVSGPHGKAPYRQRQVVADAASIETLSDIVRQLEDLEGQREWRFDWEPIHADRSHAHRAIASGDFAAAVVAYSSAVRRLMKALRDENAQRPSDSTINLGEE